MAGDKRSLVVNIITAATVLAVGTIAGGVALVPYLQEQGDITLVSFQRSLVLGLLLVSSFSYVAVIVLSVPSFISAGQGQWNRLNLAVFILVIQGASSASVALQFFWSLLIGDYTEGPTAPDVKLVVPD